MELVSAHRLRNDLKELHLIGAWVGEFATRAAASPQVKSALDHAIVEWVTNVISYAFEDTAEHFILLRFSAADGKARVEIEDDGRPFNPLALPPVDTTAPLEARPIGGLGVHMMRTLMDEVAYARAGDRNILTLTKRLRG